MSRPRLSGGPRRAFAAVLVLHGGREHGLEPTRPLQLSYLRMIDFSLGLRRTARDCAVYVLRYSVRGWNPELSEPSPVGDARWAVDEISRRHPGAPIAVLGHSMGGRTAFAVADLPQVTGICALAPWLPAGEPLPTRTDLTCVLAHGTADQMTSAALTSQYSARLRQLGTPVALFEQPGGRHALMDQPRWWHRFAVRTSLALAGDQPVPSGVGRQLTADTFSPGQLTEFDA